MVKAYGNLLEPKIKKGSMYLNLDNEICRVILLNPKDNRVDIKQYGGVGSIETIELDTAHLCLKPLFTIKEVAKMFNKATDTLRKYERMGILPRCPQYQMGGKVVRLYAIDDIMNVAEALAQRKPVGRPPARKIDISKVNQKDLVDGLLKKYRRQNV
jgi:hypothetical protein